MPRARPAPTRVSAAAIAARLAEALPAITAGDAGTLMGPWSDPEALDLLALLDAGAAPPYGWHRNPGRPDRVSLDRPILGVVVEAADPSALMDGLEHLARTADALLPQVQATIGSAPLAPFLAAALRRFVSLAGPTGVAFRPAAVVPGRATGAEPDPAPWHAPEVEDHRAIVPPKPRPAR